MHLPCPLHALYEPSNHQMLEWPLTAAKHCFVLPAAASSIPASHKASWYTLVPLSSATVSALPGISSITGQRTVRHLGIRLGFSMQAACQQTFTGIYHAIKAKVSHWSARGLSFLGRVHKAWQLLCGIMPPFKGHQNSCSIKSAVSSATMWHQHSRAATAMLPWP